MRHLLFFAIVCVTACVAPEADYEKVDPSKVETYFTHDTTYDESTISILYKQQINMYEKPYTIGIRYNPKKGWELNFSLFHHYEYVKDYPSKALLTIDDKTIEINTVTKSDFMGHTSFLYYKDFDIPSLLKQISSAKTVTFTAIGKEKQVFTWSPELIDRAKKTLEYYEKLKDTKPVFK